MLKKILFDSFIYAILPKITMVFSLFLMPITTKYLTDLDYGIWGIIAAYSGLLAGLRELGTSVILSNSFYKHPKGFKLIWSNLLAFYYIWGIVYGLMFGVLLYFIIPEEAEHNKWLILALMIIPSLLFNPIISIGARFYQLSRKPLPVTIISVIMGCIGIIISFTGIVYYKLGYMAWIIAAAIPSLLSGLVYFYLFVIKKGFIPIFRFNRSTYRRYLKISLPIVPHQYASYILNSSDRVILDVYSIPSGNIGRYNFAYNYGNYTGSLASGLAKGVRPFFYKILSRDIGSMEGLLQFRRVTFLIQGASLLFCFLVSLWLKEAFYILVNNYELRNMYSLAIVCVMSFSMNTMYQNVSITLNFNQRTAELSKVSFTAAIINIVLNLSLIPIFGYWIAAVTTLFSVAYLSFGGMLKKNYRECQPLNNYVLYWVFAVLIFTSGAFCLADAHILIKSIISVSFILFGAFLYFKFFKGRISYD